MLVSGEDLIKNRPPVSRGILTISTIEQEDLFVIGDVHGCVDQLGELLHKLPLGPKSAIVFVGDYIDRGPSSRQVIELILELRRYHRVFPLLGNHESLLLDFIDDPTPLKRARFTYNGGGATLQSYCVESGEFSIPPEHVAFFRSLSLAQQTSSHVLVHAGLPDLPLDAIRLQEQRDTLLWVRGTFHRSTFDWGKTIVHGHSRVPKVHIDPRRINVDTGCVYGGALSAVHLPSLRTYRVPMRAPVTHEYLREPAPSRRKAVRFPGRVDVRLSEPEGLPLFHTLNFNDFGVLLACSTESDSFVLSVHQEVAGTLLPDDERGNVDFRGVVVRVEGAAPPYQYAVQFHAPATVEE